jgi:GGDEF domain-containing protein
MRPSSSASWAARATIALTAAFIALAAQVAPAGAQVLPVTPPTTSVQTPAGGATVGGDGIDLNAGSGATQVGVGVGPGGVSVRLPGTTDGPGTPTNPGSGSGSAPSSPGAATPAPAASKPGRKTPASDPGGSNRDPHGRTEGATVKRKQPGGRASSESSAGDVGAPVSAETVASRGKAQKQSSDSPSVVEFIDRIPATVRAGLVALGLIALVLWILWVRARRELERNAFVDLTSGVSNPPAFMPLLERELKRSERYERPFGLVMLDVTEGRSRFRRRARLTPRVLRRATRRIAGRVRDADTVVQLSQNRFAVLCPESTAASVETLARSLEQCFEERRVHVMVGTAALRPGDQSPDDLVARALPTTDGESEPIKSEPQPVEPPLVATG